ncbi:MULTISPECIES: hypothetical protein [Pseudomonas]|uniref:hypothetical protein n=1 Tax=Pseudomonas TaxID=286 RepID=UPI0007B3D173|nr:MULTISPECIES: hypothetical protein [Pseudomonas]AZC51138.1 hypothetical protein C4K35_3555 [Pseudomonas chlororaphis subsp. piscium]AZC57716.1 hypothetical protein C4K34_3551 [Pseudomonas chlororaphis subsp. piscium]AZC63928.1 hypothetical protein C4K33_3436 [Pseudomonas chlororaphis subsp. piscium]AZC70167.1 hypothetical protein C4K32_3505 [Pseudomonas chlororaphis subsp. piscium]AZC76431.1 hypothetical protein C4K31_3528 [Pseudomonas chlororaphis subsp. piscium]
MIAKLFVTIGIIFYAVVVPVLEINETHVFNPAWEPHARLHEVWQLFTNTAIGVFSLWLVWLKGNLRLSSLLTLFVTGGFLLAYWLRQSYGGSMVLTDGSEKLILGVNLGLFAYVLAILLAAIAVAIDWRKRPELL